MRCGISHETLNVIRDLMTRTRPQDVAVLRWDDIAYGCRSLTWGRAKYLLAFGASIVSGTNKRAVHLVCMKRSFEKLCYGHRLHKLVHVMGIDCISLYNLQESLHRHSFLHFELCPWHKLTPISTRVFFGVANHVCLLYSLIFSSSFEAHSWLRSPSPSLRDHLSCGPPPWCLLLISRC